MNDAISALLKSRLDYTIIVEGLAMVVGGGSYLLTRSTTSLINWSRRSGDDYSSSFNVL